MEHITKTKETRDVLNGRWGDAAVAFGLISDEAHERSTQIRQNTESNRKRVFEVQARLLSLRRHALRDEDLPAIATIHDDMKWIELAQQHGITPEMLNECRAEVNTGIGIDANIPASGDIAVQLEFINGQDKNAVLAAQAGERTLRAVESITELSEPITQEAFAQVLDAPKWKPIGNDQDPAYLKAAQEVDFKAELLAAAIKLAPEMMKDGEKSLPIRQAMISLDALSTVAYANTANVLIGNGHDAAANQLQEAASQIAQEKKIENPYGFENTASHMRVVDEGLKVATDYLAQNGKLEPQLQEKLKAAVEAKSFTGHGRSDRGIV